MPGHSPRLLSQAATYLRKRRIYDAKQMYAPGSVRRPQQPFLPPGVWVHAEEYLKRQITNLDLTLPPVFTKKQMYVAAALIFLWDSQGPEAQFTYDEIQDIAFNVVRIDNETLTRPPCRETISLVLYMFHDSGAAKYVPGFTGVKSQITVVDLKSLLTVGKAKRRHQVELPILLLSTPLDRLKTPLPPVLNSRVFGYYTLLSELYSTRRGVQAGKVTREFNKQLVKQGLKGHVVTEYLDKLIYPTQTWYVQVADSDDWKLQIAVNATVHHFRDHVDPSEKPVETSVGRVSSDPTSESVEMPADPMKSYFTQPGSSDILDESELRISKDPP